MAKKRFNLTDTMEDVNNFIQSPKEEVAAIESQPTEIAVDGNEEEKLVSESGAERSASEEKPAERVGEERYDPTVPNTKYKRNITLSEEMLWRLNYIKGRRNKSRAKGEKFVSIDQVMFEMVQQVLDEKYAITKVKFKEEMNYR